MMNPIALKDEARDQAYAYFDLNIRKLIRNKEGKIDPTAFGLEDNDVDAFRHAYVSGVFTQEYGESTANTLGQLNEYLSFGSSSSGNKASSNMDLWNNEVGRKYGKLTNDRKSLLEKIHKALLDKELITNPSDSRQYEGSILPSKAKSSVIVLEEDENGRNTLFFDLVSHKTMLLKEFISAIQMGQYPSYGIRNVKGRLIPFSKPDGSDKNNLG